MNVENYEALLRKPEYHDPILKQLDRIDSENSLRGFIECAWEVLEPGRNFVPGWHIDAICEHLEAVTEGDIKRLLINIPPGCMKSLTTNVFWPAWEWGPLGLAHHRYVCASYSSDLTIRDNRRCRNLIQSEWYQQLWGDQFYLTGDQNAKTKFENDSTGFKLATSVGGVGTGERGDRVVIDDPHNVRDGESEKKRQEALYWFTETVPTRMSDPENSAIVLIMQRVHQQDVSGLILERELGYTHLSLPMEYEPTTHCVIPETGFEDPRTEENELLWKDRMTREVVERDKKVMGSYATAGQFQQRPSPRGGGMFKEEWFEYVDPNEVPAIGMVVRGWDLAATTEAENPDAAWTVGLKMKRTTNGIFYIEHVIRFRGSAGTVENNIYNTATNDGGPVRISIPQDPGQAGKAQKKAFAKKLIGFDVRFSPESGDKEMRANPLAAQAEAGNVKIVRGPWNHTFMDEATVFPRSKFKDQIDAASRAFAELIPARRRKVATQAVAITAGGYRG